MATADEEAMEGHREGLEMEAAKGPVSTISVGWESYGCSAGVSAHHEGGMQRFRERVPPEDRGEDEIGEEGGPGPP